MPAISRADLEQAVLDALPGDGSFVEYETLVNALGTSSNYQAVQYIRPMKRQGKVKMRVRVLETGQTVHEVALGGV